jgi:hypothetical protein
MQAGSVETPHAAKVVYNLGWYIPKKLIFSKEKVMAKKEVNIFDGKVIVVVNHKYDVYEKPLPAGIDTGINWLGSFGISEKETGRKYKGKVPKYEIQTPDMEGKRLLFWSDGKAKEVPGQKIITKKKLKYRMGELDLGDPPVGWD